MAFGVALAAMSCFAVDSSANTPLNDGIDRTELTIAQNNVLAFVLAMGIWPTELFSNKRKGFRFPACSPVYFCTSPKIKNFDLRTINEKGAM